MVAVVGGPAQRQLGEVARADDEASLLVGDVHDDLRALARLAVLVGDVVDALVVADVSKVLTHGRGNVDLAQLHAEGVCQRGGVAVRALGGAKARHGNRNDALTVESEQVKGPHGHKQGQRGVQAAGDADDRAVAVRVVETLGQAPRLDGEDVLAAGVALGPVGRNEGVRVNAARTLGL